MTPVERDKEQLLEQALEWYVRLQDEDVSAQARQDCAQWLAADTAHQHAWDRAEQVWKGLQPIADHLSGGSDAVPAEASVSVLRSTWRSRRPYRRMLACAAVLVLVAAGFMLSDPAYRAEYRTAVAIQQQWQLEDGSIMHLAPGSALDVNYTQGQRLVRLHRGKAWFQVAPDPQRPFVVQAQAGQTEALGTAFEVSQQQQGVRVLVSEHRVRISTEHTQVQLEQGQAGYYDRHGVHPAGLLNVRTALAWQRQRLVFEDVELEQVIAELQPYSRSRLVISDPALASLPVTAVFDTRQPQQALDSLALILSLRQTRVGPWLTLLRPDA